MPEINSNKAVQMLKDLFINEGAMERGASSAEQGLLRSSGERVMRNSETAATDLKTARGLAGSKKAGNYDLKTDATIRNALADGADISNAETMAKYGKKYDSALSRNTKIGAAKDYFTKPINDLKSSDASTRNMAIGQLAARSAAVAGGAMAVGGITHDIFSDDESDIGFGSGVSNTIGASAIAGGGAAAAAGISLLKKL